MLISIKYYSLPVLVIALLVVIALSTVTAIGHNNEGLVIVVTFRNLMEDVGLITCEGDEVIPLVPEGVDPHNYQLRPKDIELLRKADIVVSTGHTPFEYRIRNLVVSEKLRCKLIEIPKIPGIKLLENVETKQPNYHMPIYDPRNYVVFMEYLTKVLISLRPSKELCYKTKLQFVKGRIEELIRVFGGKFIAKAIADLPYTEYSTRWLGIDVVHLLVKEPGIPITPTDYLRIISMVKERKVDLVVVSYPEVSKESKNLVELAKKYGVPVLKVPLPYLRNSTICKLEYIVSQLIKHPEEVKTTLTLRGSSLTKSYSLLPLAVIAILTVLAIFIVSLALVTMIRRR